MGIFFRKPSEADERRIQNSDTSKISRTSTVLGTTLGTRLTTENLFGLPCSHGANTERIQISPVML